MAGRGSSYVAGSGFREQTTDVVSATRTVADGSKRHTAASQTNHKYTVSTSSRALIGFFIMKLHANMQWAFVIILRWLSNVVEVVS